MSRGESIAVAPVPLPPTLRQTLVSTFDACQFAAYLSVLAGGIQPAHPIFRGRAFHETAQRATNAMIVNGEVTIAPDDAKAVMLEVLKDHPEWVVPAFAQDELRVMVHRWATHFQLPSGQCVAEQPWRMRVSGETVTGTVDLCWRDGDTIHVRDYKAGWQVYTQAEVSGKEQDTGIARGARAPQLIIYALLIADGEPTVTSPPFSTRGVNKFDCRFVFPMQGGDTGLLERAIVINRPELIEHREWLAGLVHRMSNRFAASRFTAVTGSHCSRCPEQQACPLRKGASPVGPFERNPREAAEDWQFLDRDAKALWASFRSYVDQFGPVDVGVDQQIAMTATASGSRMALRKREAA